ncbi:MAG: hypothetical protein KDD70_02675 [Bdellovibrionales bacterium]|nr:hypothetical protein [Bdellovibrionales bacterium]
MNDRLSSKHGGGFPDDLRGQSFERQHREMRSTLLPGRFNGHIAKLLTVDNHVIALGKFDSIEGRGGFGNSPAHNVAWLDLSSGDHLGWKTTHSPIPLERISDAVWCDAGLFVGGIGGTYCIVPEMGAPVPSRGRGLEKLQASSDLRLPGSETLARLLSFSDREATSSDLPRILSAKPSSLAALQVPNSGDSGSIVDAAQSPRVAEVLGRNTTTTLPFERFQSPSYECRTLCVHNGAVVAGFSPAYQNWQYACKGGPTLALEATVLATLFSKSDKNSSPIVQWDGSRSEWISLGAIEGVVLDIESTNSQLFAINHEGTFYRYEGRGAWKKMREFYDEFEARPHRMKAYDQYLVLLRGSGRSSHCGQSGALVFDSEKGNWSELPVEFQMGGGVNDISITPDAIIFAGREIRFQGKNRYRNTIAITTEGLKGKQFHKAFRSDAIVEMPSGPSLSKATLLAHVNDIDQIAFAVSASESQIELIQF